jgi:hypothetical protein
MTPQEQIDCYNDYRTDADRLSLCYAAYDTSPFSEAKNWLKQQLVSLPGSYGLTDKISPQLSSLSPTIVLGADKRLYQRISVDLGYASRSIHRVVAAFSQFPFFSEVQSTESGFPGSAITLDIPLLDWPFDTAVFLMTVLKRPGSLPAKWRWPTITKAFAPTHDIEQIPVYFAAGLLPDDVHGLLRSLSAYLSHSNVLSTPLPGGIVFE